MDECSKCKYRKPCEQLNFLNVADNCSDLRKFVDEIRADVIEECIKFVDEWDSVIADALAKNIRNIRK